MDITGLQNAIEALAGLLPWIPVAAAAALLLTLARLR
jgi:hypothetical protein